MADEVWAPGADEAHKAHYVPLAVVTRVLLVLQLCMVGLSVLMLASDLLWAGVEPYFLQNPRRWALLSSIAFNGKVHSRLAMTVLLLTSAPVWLYWHWRAAENLRVLGVRLTHAPIGHAVWWLVPFANLFVPYRAMVELYRASTRTDGASFGARSDAPPLFRAWWGWWIVGNALSIVIFPVVVDSEDVALLADLIRTPLSLTATFLYLKFVREISAGQQAIAST